jgi:N-acetylneuraminate synthase
MNKVRIIAEVGVNHDGSLEIAQRLIDVAADAGADVVKFQAFHAEDLVTRSAPRADYQTKNIGSEGNQYEMLKALELSADDFRTLKFYCEKRGIGFLVTPFDSRSLDLLTNDLGLRELKISSGDLGNAPLLLEAAPRVDDIIISTGMANLDDVRQALGVLAFGFVASGEHPGRKAFEQARTSAAGAQALRERVTVLHCTTDYPTADRDVNLRAMATLRAEFGLRTGLSDHTDGWLIAAAAVACGAEVIEKHITLDRGRPGPDHRASLEPSQLQEMVRAIRQVETALGRGEKIPTAAESANIPAARKSLVAARAIRKGEAFTAENLTTKRPGTGVAPIYYWDWLGKTATRDYAQDELIDP